MYAYRGIMLDISRHFIPIENIKRLLEGMSLTKLNKLHLHISDADSFPMESLTYPKLIEFTSFSPGERYSIWNITDIVNYAQAFGISVVPEIDSPGHSNCLGNYIQLQQYLSCYNVYKGHWEVKGGPPAGQINPSLDGSYTMMESMYNDLSVLFPSPLVHMGGDEVIQSCWNTTQIN